MTTHKDPRLAAIGKRTPDWLAKCPGCGTVASYLGPDRCVEDWDGTTYRFKCCGHRAHLDSDGGGAKTWVAHRKAQ